MITLLVSMFFTSQPVTFLPLAFKDVAACNAARTKLLAEFAAVPDTVKPVHVSATCIEGATQMLRTGSLPNYYPIVGGTDFPR